MKQAIQDLMQDFSIEVTPRSWLRDREHLALLPPKTRIFVTFLPQHRLDDTLKTCEAIWAQGFRPVPHLAARNLRQVDDLKRFYEALQHWQGEALLIAGAAKKARAFDSSLSVLQQAQSMEFPWQALYFAGHPEGSPDISTAALKEAERKKDEWLQEHRFNGAWVSQLCFSAEALLNWAADLQSRQLQAGVVVGIAGRTHITSLMRFAQQCGIGNSLRFLKQNRSKIWNLFKRYDPCPLLYTLAQARHEKRFPAFQHIHVYPFGTLRDTALWLNKIQEGRFDVFEDSFRVY